MSKAIDQNFTRNAVATPATGSDQKAMAVDGSVQNRNRRLASTLSAQGIASILELARLKGASADGIATAAGIPLSQLQRANAQLSVDQFFSFYDEIARQTKEPDIGLYIGRISFLESMHVLLYLANASRNLRDWLNMLPSLNKLVGDIGAINVKTVGSHFVLQYHPRIARKQRCVLTDSVLVASRLQMDTFCLLPVKPERVDLPYPKPRCERKLIETFGVNPHYSQAVAGLYYPRAALTKPQIHVSTKFYDNVALDYAEVMSDAATTLADPFFMSLHAAIRRQLPSGRCSLATVAKDLETSVRTLQRRLGERDTQFQEVLISIKSALAQKYLADDSLSHIEIAFLLGYSDQSTFSAAFKKWTSQSPREYRAALKR